MIVDTAGGPGARSTMIAGIGIFTEKAALSALLAHSQFKSYHSTVKSEGLYSKTEEVVAWYPRGGFIARGATAQPHGKGTIVMVAKFILKTEMGPREAALKILR
jgi:hypothetical protein